MSIVKQNWFVKKYFLYFRYSFAIVGINITAMAYKLVMDGCAKSHFFNVCASSPVESERTPLLKHFHHFYSYLFVEFDKFWLSEKPKDVMEFNRIRDLFENNIRTLLEDRSAHFKINITVDTVWILMTNKPKCFSLSLHCGKILKIVSVKYLKIAKKCRIFTPIGFHRFWQS